MSGTKYIQLKLSGQNLDIPQDEDIPISIDFEIEDSQDFRQKKSGSSLNITVPSTINNSSKLNTLFNDNVEDTTSEKIFNKPMDIILSTAGHELLKGKAFVTGAKKVNGIPNSFEINCFGDNGDWVIPLKEITLHDIVSDVTHIFDKATMEDSWNYDGQVENEFYVYAPLRNRESFGLPNSNDTPGMIYRPINSRPALFIYWFLYWGFKKAGYQIQSNFLDTDYFRRMVMPWTWGNFFYITDKLLKEMGFLATGNVTIGNHGNGSLLGINGAAVSTPAYMWQVCNRGGYTGSSTVNDYARYDINNNEHNWRLDNVTTDIGYIGNALSYAHNLATGESTWTYLAAYSSLGLITVGFEVRLSCTIDCSFTSNANVDVEIYKNGVLYFTKANLFAASASASGTAIDYGTRDVFIEVENLSPGDQVSMKIKYHLFKSGTGFAYLKILGTADQIFVHPFSTSLLREDVRSYFKLQYIRRQLGSIINFKDFDKLKNYKWIDLLRGVIDTFNLQLNTNVTEKKVVIEPTHTYSTNADLTTNLQPGYYNNQIEDWTSKEDASGVNSVEIFQDFEQMVEMKYKEDGNDGILKLMTDRHQANLNGIKYVFSERFRKGTEQIENRFFSPVVHYEHAQWKSITGIAPQLIVLIPENISNTSNPESEYTFNPKIAWYKGVADKNIVGGWNWDGDDTLDLPYMFAVNYKSGGENDPVLTYCDQRINLTGTSYVKAHGLFKRFFLQRFAIMRHGKLVSKNMKLNSTDIIDQIHREYKSIKGQRYQLIKIAGYKPLMNLSTSCLLWRWYPVTQEDAESIYPTDTAVMTGKPILDTPDILYVPLLCLITDIPQ